MKALTSPSCRVCLERGPTSFSSSCSSSFVGRSFEKCFLQSRKVSGFGFLNSVLVKQSEAIIYPVSCVSSKTQVDFGIENAETEERYKSSTVHVKFLLLKECVFGEQFLIVGDDPMFGLWDPESAVPLNWSEGHLWTVELDIPVGKLIQFKFILKDGSGEIVWQPGADRVFQTWETKNTITVSEDWENAELQIVSEEEQAAIQQEDSPVNSELTVVSRQEELVVEENIESAISNKESSQGEQPLEEPIKGQLVADNISPLQEKPKSSVANDISDTKTDPRVSFNPQVPSEKSSNKDSSQGEQPLEEPIKGQLVADNISPLQEKPKSSVANDISDTKTGPRVSFNPQIPSEKSSNKDSSQGEQPLEEPIKGQLVADNISPLQEKPKSSVANDISDTKTDPRVSYNPQVPSEKRVDSGNENSNVIWNNNVTKVDEILGNNGTVETAKNLASTNLVDCEGEPVLVPGLTPPPSVPTEEENHDQVDKRNSVDESTEAVEAKDHNLPEIQLDEKQEPESHLSEKGTTDETFGNGKEESSGNELQQKPYFLKMEERFDSEPEDDDDILENDLQWAGKALKKFLTRFRLF